jgi:hypothetical protein
LLLPPDVGIPVDAGTLILTQVHYHPAGVGGSDTTSVALRLSPIKPAWRYELGVYGNSPGAPNLQPGDGDPDTGPAFVIPANAANHVEWMRMQHAPSLNKQLHVLGVTPHMHMLGTHERAVLEHADGSQECLIDSNWSFDWQRTYFYDAPLEQLPIFDPLSVVDLKCTWNNSLANPMLTRLLTERGLAAPYDVPLGFSSWDEMCLADFAMVTPN